jgi:hypothetical protein
MLISNKLRMFEILSRIDESFVLCEVDDLPPGFDASDIKNLDQIIDDINEEFDDIKTTKFNADDVFSGEKINGKRNRENPYLHGSLIAGIVDENGKEYDLEKLKNLITQRPKNVVQKGTSKLKKDNILKITLPSYRGIFFDIKQNKFKIVNTCPNAGECKDYCYAQRGYYIVFKASSLNSTRTLNFLLNDWKSFKYKVIDDIKQNESAGKQTILRWHDSGDFLSEKYLDIVIDIAKETPNVIHYAYTKMISNTKNRELPDNLRIRFSFDDLAPENDQIDMKSDKYTKVLPKNFFKGLLERVKISDKEYKWVYKSEEAKIEAKNRVATEYGLNVDSVVTNDEINKIPENDKNKWNVIILHKEGDIAASRNDVSGIYLMYH